ncbi:MAG TPA: hypothetical protein VHS55_06935 [Solirubrobacteraceae bacterium]|nr:hypothetical protein [Solirubrobacteraceae bacterium]
MRSVQLQTALSAFVEQAAAHLHADVLAGQEVPFDLETRSARMRGASLYCYRSLTDAFIAERFSELRRLDAYPPAAALLEQCDTLDRYLLARGQDASRRGERQADAALLALLCEVFEQQTDFDPSWIVENSERMERALERLDGSSLPKAGEVTLVAALHGLAISSPEIHLTRGLSIAQPDALQGAPEQALRVGGRGSGGGLTGGRECAQHLLVLYTTTDAPSSAEGVADGVEVVRELLRALRLFGDGRISLGERAWARAGEGEWNTLALGSGGHPHGILLVTSEQEDELRAFCNLVSRRAPHASPIAWALRRFELGCDRISEYEGLSDHLLALRALLGGPSELEQADRGSHRVPRVGYRSPIGGAPDGLLAGRLAALCATPERHSELAERTLAAIELEREAIVVGAVERAGGLAVARDLADHLRALLRDVICGHLRPELAGLADEILLSADAHGASEQSAHDEVAAEQQALSEQELGDLGDPAEVLRVAV